MTLKQGTLSHLFYCFQQKRVSLINDQNGFLSTYTLRLLGLSKLTVNPFCPLYTKHSPYYVFQEYSLEPKDRTIYNLIFFLISNLLFIHSDLRNNPSIIFFLYYLNHNHNKNEVNDQFKL